MIHQGTSVQELETATSYFRLIANVARLLITSFTTPGDEPGVIAGTSSEIKCLNLYVLQYKILKSKYVRKVGIP